LINQYQKLIIMTIPQLRNFLVLAEALNFRKASEQTYIAQPALSRQIKLLEEEIGAELFDRSKKQIKLTPAGVHFSKELAKILNQLNDLVRKTASIQNGKAGTIRIGHASSAMHSILPGLLNHTKSVLPDVKTDLVEGSNQFIFKKLYDNEVDFGFVPNAFIPEGLSSTIVYEENYLLILPKEHKINRRNFKSLQACREENWILHPHDEGSGYMETILKIITSYGFYPKIIHRSPNTSTVLRLVEAGLGIAMMGKSTIKGFDLNIKWIELSDIPHKLDMKLVWKSDRDGELHPYLKFIRQYLRV
jgi:LysR family transcriptional regulator, benzoate and cis,cis-muconate-responsive activator of ben and cat genes